MSYDLSPLIIKGIKEIAEKYPIAKVVLFGSRARGNNKPKSDVDLAIYFSQESSEQGRFASDIEDLETLLKIDIVFIDENTDKNLILNIEKEGVTIYERL